MNLCQSCRFDSTKLDKMTLLTSATFGINPLCFLTSTHFLLCPLCSDNPSKASSCRVSSPFLKNLFADSLSCLVFAFQATSHHHPTSDTTLFFAVNQSAARLCAKLLWQLAPRAHFGDSEESAVLSVCKFFQVFTIQKNMRPHLKETACGDTVRGSTQYERKHD